MGLLDDAIREHLELKRRRGADASEVSREESDALGPVRRSPEGVPELADPSAAQVPALDEPTAAVDAPAAPAAPWEEETTVHTPPPAPSYEPPTVPPAVSAPEPPAEVVPPPESVEPPPVPAPPAHARFAERSPAPAPPPPDPDPDFDPFPELADEPVVQPPAAERGSLLSRFLRGRREHAHEHDDPPTAAREEPASEPAAAAYEPPPAPAPAYQPPPLPYTPPAAHEPDIVPADEEPEGEDLLEETPDFLEETPEHDRLWFEQRPPRDFDFDG
jgi:hypothetical protein